MCSTSRVFPQPVGPVSITERRCSYARLNSSTSLPLALYKSVLMLGPQTGKSRRDELAMNARQSARQLLDALDPRRAPRPEHVGQRIDQGLSDADVVNGDAGLAGLLHRVRSVGPRVTAFVAVVGDEAVTDHDQDAPLRSLIEQAPGQMTQGSAESRVPTGAEAQRARHDGIRVREVPQARHLDAMTRV